MSVIAEAAPKAAAEPLAARAARPLALRARMVAVISILAGFGIFLSGGLAYRFIVQPKLAAMAPPKEPPKSATPAAVTTTPVIAKRIAAYDQPGGQPTRAPLGPPRVGVGADAQSASVSAAGSSSTPATSPAPAPIVQAPPAPGTPSIAQEAKRSGLFFNADARSRPAPGIIVSAAGPAPEAPVSAQAQADYDAAYGRHVLIAPRSPFEVKAGTLIPAALLTAVDTGRPGPVIGVTTEPVFDTVTGRTLLIPQGTRLIGAQAGDSTYGEKRAFLVWKRLILPNGKSLLLEDQAATDASGATGVPGHADRRWAQLGGAILLSGAITTLGETARSNNQSRSLIGDAGDATAIQAVQVGGRLIDRELNVQPKIVVRAGALVQVLLTKDLVLEPAS